MSTDDLNRLLQPLSPSNSLQDADEQFPVYQMFLEDAFGQSDIKNIALTGNFGAGKSSILRSFDKSQNGGKEKYLYISLADFELNGKVNGNQDFIETPFENKGTGEELMREKNHQRKVRKTLHRKHRNEWSIVYSAKF